MTTLVEVTTTVATEEEARRLAAALVEAGVMACVTFHAVRSVYRWQGEIHDEPEYQLVGKTRASLAARAEEFIRANHPYDTPAVLTVPVLRANEDYAEWVSASVRSDS